MLDFMVMEAVSLKVRKEDAKAQEQADRKNWRSTKDKGNFANLDKYR